MVLFLDARNGIQFKVRTFACQLMTEDLRNAAIEQLNTGNEISQWYESNRTVIAFEVRLTYFTRNSMFAVLKDKLILLERYEQQRQAESKVFECEIRQ